MIQYFKDYGQTANRFTESELGWGETRLTLAQLLKFLILVYQNNSCVLVPSNGTYERKGSG